MTVWTAYLLTVMVMSGIILTTGWRGKRPVNLVPPQSRNDAHLLPHDPELESQNPEPAEAQPQADVALAMHLALKRLAPVLLSQSVHVELAIPPGLLVRVRSAVLADLLEDLLTAAIHAAPACRLLLTAAARGDRIYVSVTDDMPGADPAIRLASVRGLMERVALRGGALDIDVRLTEGTSMTLRFAAMAANRQEKADYPPASSARTAPVEAIALAVRD